MSNRMLLSIYDDLTFILLRFESDYYDLLGIVLNSYDQDSLLARELLLEILLESLVKIPIKSLLKYWKLFAPELGWEILQDFKWRKS